MDRKSLQFQNILSLKEIKCHYNPYQIFKDVLCMIMLWAGRISAVSLVKSLKKLVTEGCHDMLTAPFPQNLSSYP